MGKWAAGSLHHEIQLDGEKKKCEASFEEEREREKEEGRWGLIPSGSCSDGGVQQGKKKKWEQILTLRSNPITLPNWIGCVQCSDRIRALKRAPVQAWGEPFGPPSQILFGLWTVKAAAK